MHHSANEIIKDSSIFANSFESKAKKDKKDLFAEK
jgi:hypothetical protein